MNTTNTANSIATMKVTDSESLREWLRLAGGSLPGEFLRLQGLNPAELVTQGLLRVGPGRWSDAYVAGRLLGIRPFNVPVRVAA
jgi:hypothetical protein